MIKEKKKYLTWITFPSLQELKPGISQVYLQASEKVFLFSHIRIPFYTLRFDFNIPAEEWLMSLSSKSRNKIRRAGKDHLQFITDQDIDTIIELFNLTVQAKNLAPINTEKFDPHIPHLVTKLATTSGEVLVAHFYYLDQDQKIALLRYNCSAYRKSNESEFKAMCGRANRLLFYEDYQYFQNRGFSFLDFGGYNPKDKAKAIKTVNDFKSDLGGIPIRQYNYYPIPYWLFRQIRNTISKSRFFQSLL
ncbi:MAG: hypothetical protein AAFO07_07190 [Bacteroidota bacterium]